MLRRYLKLPLFEFFARPSRRDLILLEASVYFDETHYRSQIDVGTKSAIMHYHTIGWRLGYSPSLAFDNNYYLSRYEDVKLASVNPLLHYIEHGAFEGRTPFRTFNRELFLSHHPQFNQPSIDPAAECLRMYGTYDWKIPASPLKRANPLFDARWYIEASPDLGIKPEDAYNHYLDIGWREGRDPNPLFDTDWYLAKYPYVKQSGMDPLTHYETFGHIKPYQPNPLFDASWYLATYPDVAYHKVNPLLHYIEHGQFENRDPHLRFSTQWHTETYPESGKYRWGSFAHYIRIGRSRGNRPHALYADILQFSDAEANAVTRTLLDDHVSLQKLDAYDSWLEVNGDSLPDRQLLARKLIANHGKMPLISVVMPAYNSDAKLLIAAINSVRSQIYQNWELCICDDASPDSSVSELISRMAILDSRIKWVRSEQNENISAASNRAASLASGEVIALLDHDDLLHPHALAEIALCYADHPDADIVYTDDDKIDMSGRRYAPQFKPDWSPTLLLSYMYISHLFTFKRDLFERVGRFRTGFDGSQDFDLALRMSEQARLVKHIPKILYHWRAAPNSTASSGSAKPSAFERGRKAVEEALIRRGIRAHVVHPEFARAAHVGIFEPRFGDEGPSVAILIPTKDKLPLLRNCLDSLRKTSYRRYEVFILDNESTEQDTLDYLSKCPEKVIRIANSNKGFSFSHLINVGVAATASDLVLLLNNDTEIINPGWLSQMVGYTQFSGVGAVGARLLYGDGRVQHAGITHGLHEGMAGHSFKLISSDDFGYMALAKVSREVAGVTGACLLTPRSTFLELGGLDDTNFAVAYNDVDYCYRLEDAGYSCLQCASAELYHYEGQTRGFSDNPAEERSMRSKYFGRVDRYYNPNLTLHDEQFGVARTHLSIENSRKTAIRSLFVSHNLNHEGAPNSLYELAHGLASLNIADPEVISPADGPLRAVYDAQGIPVSIIDHPLASWPPSHVMDDRLNRLAQSFRYAGIEVVIANTADSFWAIEAASRAGIPSIWIIRESEPWATYYSELPGYLQAMAYKCFSTAYRVVFVARSTMEAWSPLNGRGGFTLIRNGLNDTSLAAKLGEVNRADARLRMGVESSSVVFSVVGTVSERKGQMDLVRAFAELDDASASHIEIFIVGDRPSPYSVEVRDMVKAMPPSRARRVHIVPETSDVPLYLKGSDVFVCTSIRESYPRVVLEAMSAGLPIITTPVWGIREQVRPGFNAIFYEPGDVAELAESMKLLASNVELREKFSENSRVMFESLPSYRFMLAEYARLVQGASGASTALSRNSEFEGSL